MTASRSVLIVALVGVGLSACTRLAPPTTLPASVAVAPGANAVVAVREQGSGRYIALIGPKAQDAPPYLGVPDTNFYCLRSFLDRRTGETAHQLYVSESYDGVARKWDSAHDAAGHALVFIPISRNEISCGETGCSYAEEFASNIPEGELRASPNGLAVSFSDRAGIKKTVTISAQQIAAQLAAVDARRNYALPPTAPGRPQSAAHQPE